MDSYDKIEELLLAEGYSKEEIPAIMVSLVEQGISPEQIFATGLADMLGFNKKTKVKPKITTTQQSGGMLGTRTIKTPGNGLPPQSPNPAWGTNAKPPTGATTPSLRPGGQTPTPNFKVSNTPTPTTPRRNNLSLQRTPQTKAPSVPSAVTSTASKSKGVGLFSRLKGVAGGAFKFLGNPYVTAASIIGDDIMSRGVADGTVTGQPGYKPDWRTPGYKSPTPTGPSATQRQVNTDNQKYGNTVPAGSFSISAKGKAQAAANRAEYAANRANTKLPAPKPPAPKPPTAQERAYGSRSKLTADQQAMNKKYDELRGLKGGRVTTPNSSALNSFLAKRGLK